MWLRKRAHFVMAAGRAASQWLLSVWKLIAPVVAIAGLLGVGVWVASEVAVWVIGVSLVVLVVLLFGEGSFRLWREADPLAAYDDLRDALTIEPHDGVKRYDRADGLSGWVLHICVANGGRKASFRAAVTTHIEGLDRPYGSAVRLRWEDADEPNLPLGHGESALLRLAEFNERGAAVRFFPIPKHRHLPGSYHPTQEFPILADELTFDLCIRNDEYDVTYERAARITFAPDGEPILSLTPLPPKPHGRA